MQGKTRGHSLNEGSLEFPNSLYSLEMPCFSKLEICWLKFFSSNSNIYVRTALFACVQYYLCVRNLIYVRSMLFNLRCDNKRPPSLYTYYFGDIWTPLPVSPRYFLAPPPTLFHIGVLLHIFCFSLQLWGNVSIFEV